MSESSDDCGRIEEGGPRFWVLMRLNRWVLTAGLLIAVYLVLVRFSQAGLDPLRRIIEDHDRLVFLFSAFIGTITTGTSIVVTINQLILCPELGAVGDQRERMQESMEFRQNIEDEIQEGVSPPEPAAFLYELLDGIEDRANRL